jgi:indolepyruvate ferredoxin oxidoreductase beta subunit
VKVTSNNNHTIVITGLGGQGLIKLLQILGDNLLQKGYKVISSEKHGLSQRGGKVTCFLRFGEKIMAPIPILGSADMIIAAEKASVLDVLEFSKPDRSSNLIIANYERHPQKDDYIRGNHLLEILNETSDYINFVPVKKIVSNLANLKIINLIILGFVAKFLPLNEESLKKSLNQYFTDEFLTLNQKAFDEGKNLNRYRCALYFNGKLP